jgi:putative flippase GtrA
MGRTLYDRWCSIDDKIRFMIIGFINAVNSYIIFAIALFLIGKDHYQLCVTLQWTVSSVFSYLMQKFFVFCTRGNYIREYLKCCTTWVVSYLLNVVVLELLVRFAIKNVYISQMLSIMIVSIATYILFKYFAFKVRPDEEAQNKS